MRATLLTVLAATGLLLLPAHVWAQRAKKPQITGVRVGFKAGFDPNEINPDTKYQYLFKAGLWTPVYVDVVAGDDLLPPGLLVVETTDSDDVQNNFTSGVPALQANENLTLLTYTKPGSLGSEIVVKLLGERGRELAQEKKVYDATPLDDLLFLSAGTRLTALRQSLLDEIREVEGNQPNATGMNSISHGRVAYADNVELLPTRWFGYNQVDLMILSTGNRDFVDQLMNRAEKARQDALAEWVRRGGRVIVTAGRNHDLAAALLQTLQMQSLPVEFVPGGMQLPRLTTVESWVKGDWSGDSKKRLQNVPTKEGQPVPPIEGAKLKIKAGQDAIVMIRAREDDTSEPLMVRMPYGMGQVTLTAFDLDQPPFSRWPGQTQFWKQMRDKLGVALVKGQGGPTRGLQYNRSDVDDLAGQLRNTLEQFPDVSNISFGWVALFIFIYILVVGPLDYFFLKKVVKRLELTWITFPTVVIVVSTVSYFTAYALKGNDLLINKIDLVDIDVTGKTVYGHTWFTLFSPRIQHYTIGIEPAAPLWAGAPTGDKRADVNLSWMGRPDTSYGGYGRARSQSLFRRAYNYTPDASGLEGVPIQVWSSKSFAASYERPIDGQLPFSADIRYEGQGRLSGTVTNHLSVPLENASLIYGGSMSGGMVYSFDEVLQPNVATRLSLKSPPRELAQWPDTMAPTSTPRPGYGGSVQTMTTDNIFKRLVFHGAYPPVNQPRNLALRELDEFWRLGLKNEVILFGRLPHKQDKAEAVTEDVVSPSRLWLGSLPAPNTRRLELPGTLKQDTYVRVFLPIQSTPAKPAP